MNKPKVIVRTNYKLAINNPDRVKKNIDKDKKYNEHIIDYFSDDKKRALNLVDYFTGKINKHDDINLVMENGKKAAPEEKTRIKKYISKQFNNSNLWQIVLSFDKKYIDSNISYDDLETKLAKEILPKVFKKMGFEDAKKMFYVFSLHTNTKHPHFHIAFMERCPNTRAKDGKLKYRRQAKIPQNVINFLKQETCLSIERNSKFKPMSININKDIEEFKKYFDSNSYNFILKNKNNIILEEKILTLGKMLYENEYGMRAKIKYNSINEDEIKKLTKEIKNDLFKIDFNLKISKKNFNDSIKMLNNYITDLGKNNKIKSSNLNFSYTEMKKKYLDNYILNAIVNSTQKYYSGQIKQLKINGNDIFKEIILNNYKQNKKYSKKDIIRTALSSNNKNYKNIYNIQKAIKNINYEMEEASQEFSKLFNYDEKNK